MSASGTRASCVRPVIGTVAQPTESSETTARTVSVRSVMGSPPSESSMSAPKAVRPGSASSMSFGEMYRRRGGLPSTNRGEARRHGAEQRCVHGYSVVSRNSIQRPPRSFDRSVQSDASR